MATANERKGLFFLAIVALSGAAVRLWRSELPHLDSDSQVAIAHQLRRIDSVRSAPRPEKRAPRKPKTASARTDAVPQVPSVIDPPPAATAALASLVDLDRADAPAIESLPGIGPALAKRIISHRDSVGLFGGMAAFCEVRGVGPALAKRLRPLVTFGASQRPLSDECGEASRQVRKTSVVRRPKPR